MAEEFLTATYEKAILLAASIRSALANGVLHYASTGELLKSEEEILNALKEEGYIQIDESFREEVMTVEEAVFQVRREWADRIQ